MKKILTTIFALTLTFSAATLPMAENKITGNTFNIGISASAEEISDGFKYEVIGNDSVEITGYSDNKKDLIIPQTIDGKKVTSIGNWAFSDCENLESVTIPDSVTSIGHFAFSNCVNLENITIPSSVTSIGWNAFDGTVWLKNKQNLNPLVIVNNILIDASSSSGKVIIPDSVKFIGDSAFRNCTNLMDVTIPDSVKSIRNSAFDGCTNLTSITIPVSVTSIGSGAFYGCENLINVTIPSSVTSIGDSAFKKTSWLKNKQKLNPLVIVNNLLIDASTASGNVIIPSDVKSIESGAFYKCANLTNVTIPNSITSIGDYAFYQCTNLTDVKIPNSVVSIGEFTFSDCLNLKSITIPNSVTSIGELTLSGCINLTNVIIPNSVKNIEKFMFSGCSNLESVTIPNSVKSIGNSAFDDCPSLKVVNYTGTNEQWNEISIGEDNNSLINATKNYNYVIEHNFGEWNVVKAATCTKDGEQQRICSDCGDIEKKTIKATGHKFVKARVNPTLKQTGYTADKCTVCGILTNVKIIAKLKDISNATVSLNSKASYTGKQIKPKIIVKIGNRVLKNGTDYTLKYGNNKSVGKGTVAIVGKGNYVGTIRKTFKIVPAKTSVNLSTLKGKINVVLKKSSSAKKIPNTVFNKQ